MTATSKRNSSMELLKIISMFLIVVSHVVISLNGTEAKPETLSLYPVATSYMMEFGHATHDFTLVCLAALRYLGNIGNEIFFFCSVFYLIRSNSVHKKKIINLVIDIWLVSIIFLGIYTTCTDYSISKDLFIFQLFPTTFSNNWYLTCYILIYAIHPVLNKIFICFDRKQILIGLAFFSCLYIGIDFFIQKGHFYSSVFIDWMLLYIIFGYLYHFTNILTNRKACGILVIAGLAGLALMIFATDIIGLATPLFSHPDSLFRWNFMTNPFIVALASGLIGLFSNIQYHNRVIDTISGLGLYVYLIHENILFRTYSRPRIWSALYDTAGFGHLFILISMYAIILYAASIIISYIYKGSIHKVTELYSGRLAAYCNRIISRL